MSVTIGGATRLYAIVGSPIAQAKSPQTFNALFAQRGLDAVMVPIEIPPQRFDACFEALLALPNLDGLVVTLPFKFAALRHAATVGPQGRLAGCVNALRRGPDGRWHGEMFDGIGFVNGLRAQGHEPRGRRALVLGAGGAGSACAAALLEAGVASLHCHDPDGERARSLADRLRSFGKLTVGDQAPRAADFDLVLNASPLGLQPADPLPLALDGLRPGTIVAEAIMEPARTRWLRLAQAAGAITHEGRHMLAGQADALATFLL